MFPLIARRLLSVLAGVVGIIGCTPHSWGVVNGAIIPLTDHRFDGVGIVEALTTPPSACGGYISGTCVLIAPNLVLTARHSVVAPTDPLPAPGVITHRARFRVGTNGTGFTNNQPWDCGTWYQETRITQFIGSPDAGVDIVLGVLETPIQGVTPIPVDTTTVPTTGRSFILAGWGLSGVCFGQGNGWQLRSASGVFTHTASGGTFLFNDCVSLSCTQCPAGSWAVANLHDSGAPILMDVPCGSGSTRELRLVGLVLNPSVAVRVSEWGRSGATPPLPVPSMECHLCRGDFNHDGDVHIEDIFEFLDAWFGGSAWAEADGVPGLSSQDVFAYVSMFFIGC